MVKKINKVRMIEKLRKRYDLEDFEPEVFAVQERALLVVDLDEIAKDPKLDGITADLSPATGYYNLFTVPDDKEWYINAIFRPSTTAATQLSVWNRGLSETISLEIAGTTGGLIHLYGYRLEGGGRVRAANTGNAGDASRNFHIWYEEIDIKE